MLTLQKLLQRLDEIAPPAIAEDWDNVGLLVGDPTTEVARVMTCLTITAETVTEAIENKVDCVVVHHPIPFKPISQITTSSSTGKYLWQLASSRIAVYSPHTAWDNSLSGINQQLADLLELDNVCPIISLNPKQSRSLPVSVPGESRPRLGTGRVGTTTTIDSLSMVLRRLRESIQDSRVQCNPVRLDRIGRIAIVCGSGGSMVGSSAKVGADLLITGEATYHQFLEATSLGMGLLTIGHYQSEGFAMSTLARLLRESFSEIEIWRSKLECDAYSTEI